MIEGALFFLGMVLAYGLLQLFVLGVLVGKDAVDGYKVLMKDTDKKD